MPSCTEKGQADPMVNGRKALVGLSRGSEKSWKCGSLLSAWRFFRC